MSKEKEPKMMTFKNPIRYIDPDFGSDGQDSKSRSRDDKSSKATAAS